jgi:hypothetical protein
MARSISGHALDEAHRPRGAVPQSDFYKGLELALAAILVAPEFLYRIESVGADGKGLDG